MSSSVAALLGACALLLWAALILARLGRRQKIGESVGRRLNSERESTRRERRQTGLTRWLSQAGLELPAWLLTGLLVLLLLLELSLARINWVLPPLSLAIVVLLCYLIGQWRARRRVERMVNQLPTFLDHMIRSVKSGRTMGDAMLLAIQRCPDPLNQAIQTARRDIELGMPMAEAIIEFAEEYRRDEFHMLALGVQVNQRYGGNSTDMLQSLIGMIRDREQASRQLSAMTGETRISAIVLAGLPIAVGGYILLTNPAFMLDIWATRPGKVMLLVSLTLQGAGCALLWRMLKSV